VTSIIDSISIKADLAGTTAKMYGFSNGIFSNNIPLAYGYNPIAIVVTAEDSVTQNIYGINILRQELAPDVTYPFSQGIFYVNKKTPTVIPTNFSDTADNYAISPNLPKGVVLSTVNGRITGMPTDTSSMKTYQIIARNFGGADTILIDFEVQYPEPVINRVSKDSVCYGDSIIVYGKYFNWVKKVMLGSKPVASYKILTDTTMKVLLGKIKTGYLSLSNIYTTGVSSFMVHVGEVPVFSVFPNPMQLCGGVAREVNTNLTSFANLSCSNGQTGTSVFVNTAGTYTITATDSIKCKGSTSFTVTNYTPCGGYLEMKSDSVINYFGDTIKVVVKIKNGVNIFSTYGYLKYDTAYLAVVDAKVGDYLGINIINQPPVVVNNEINFGMTKKTGQLGSNGDGTVYEYRFVLKKLPPSVLYDEWFYNSFPVVFSLSKLTVYNTSGIQPLSFNAISLLNDTTKCKYYVPVWPGDLNNDKKVNVADLLPIGYFYSLQGPIRPDASLQWTAQPGILWGYDIAGRNSNAYETFADGNADGIIDLADQAAIGF
ncbi:MAG: cohesin domain-containing protein, partial [Ferruginibacter sp.]